MVKDSIRDRLSVAILCVEVLADHLKMGVLTHLVRIHQTKCHMASAKLMFKTVKIFGHQGSVV